MWISAMQGLKGHMECADEYVILHLLEACVYGTYDTEHRTKNTEQKAGCLS